MLLFCMFKNMLLGHRISSHFPSLVFMYHSDVLGNLIKTLMEPMLRPTGCGVEFHGCSQQVPWKHHISIKQGWCRSHVMVTLPHWSHMLVVKTENNPLVITYVCFETHLWKVQLQLRAEASLKKEKHQVTKKNSNNVSCRQTLNIPVKPGSVEEIYKSLNDDLKCSFTFRNSLAIS